MNPLDTLDDRHLQGFFRRSKTEMSCMDKPQSFLKQLRDHELILEETFQEMIRIKSKEVMQDNVYELLNWIETERPWNIRLFWICVFKEFIMTQYPTLKRLQDSLRSLPNGENAEIWTLDKYRHHLPVTCGDKQGTLYRDKLAKGEPCILRNNEWYTPCAFQKLSGKGSRSNWKKSIRCKDTTLEKLLKDGHLTCPGYNKCKAKKSTLPCSRNTVSAIPENGEEMEEEEGELQANPDEVSVEDEVELQGNDCSTQRSDTDQGDNLEEVTDERPRVGQNEFRVKCEALSGMLHKSRFASGRCGNSIRTEDRWMSPVEFVEQGSAMPNALWRRDIQWEGQSLSSLIERKMLHLHSEQCECLLCHPDPQALEEQKSDDDCFVCGRLGDLVMCDHCPRSFHQKCHLPQLDPSILGDDSKWMCTFCIWNRNEYFFRMTYEETLMHPVSNHMLPCHYLLLSLYNADKDQIFAKDPCIHVRGYSSQIVTPMWLDKITELLGQQYTVGQLLTDIQLIFSNCDKFNQNRPEFRDMGIKLKEFYEQVVEKVFRRQ